MMSESGKRWLPGLLLGLMGLLDASYLFYVQYFPGIAPCKIGAVVDCGVVMRSEYATIYGIPLSAFGVLYYLTFIFIWNFNDSPIRNTLIYGQTLIGLLVSSVLMYLQIGVIGVICLYCTFSAIICTTLFFYVRLIDTNSYRRYILAWFGLVYQKIIKPIFFQLDPEIVHVAMVKFGQMSMQSPVIRIVTRFLLGYRSPLLHTSIGGVPVVSPFGLSAGFDYEARLTQALEPLGFGFQTVGTITNLVCPGNPTPRLGRLPKSRSLLVNKGFKNPGIKAILASLQGTSFPHPVGISIGRTNVDSVSTIPDAITDIIEAFKAVQSSTIGFSYYELNISCPNLKGNISFYEPSQLKKLLENVDELHLTKPIFIKMPIELDDKAFKKLLAVIVTHSITGIIVGNLQKDRSNSSLNAEEIQKAGKGNMSGKPTEERSNQLIALTYKLYQDKLEIIGCGGVFNAQDAYRKITLGASAVQLITGMIFQGPQVIAQMNMELEEILKHNGMKSLKQAVGAAQKMISTD